MLASAISSSEIAVNFLSGFSSALHVSKMQFIFPPICMFSNLTATDSTNLPSLLSFQSCSPIPKSNSINIAFGNLRYMFLSSHPNRPTMVLVLFPSWLEFDNCLLIICVSGYCSEDITKITQGTCFSLSPNSCRGKQKIKFKK